MFVFDYPLLVPALKALAFFLQFLVLAMQLLLKVYNEKRPTTRRRNRRNG